MSGNKKSFINFCTEGLSSVNGGVRGSPHAILFFALMCSNLLMPDKELTFTICTAPSDGLSNTKQSIVEVLFIMCQYIIRSSAELTRSISKLSDHNQKGVVFVIWMLDNVNRLPVVNLTFCLIAEVFACGRKGNLENICNMLQSLIERASMVNDGKSNKYLIERQHAYNGLECATTERSISDVNCDIDKIVVFLDNEEIREVWSTCKKRHNKGDLNVFTDDELAKVTLAYKRRRAVENEELSAVSRLPSTPNGKQYLHDLQASLMNTLHMIKNEQVYHANTQKKTNLREQQNQLKHNDLLDQLELANDEIRKLKEENAKLTTQTLSQKRRLDDISNLSNVDYPMKAAKSDISLKPQAADQPNQLSVSSTMDAISKKQWNNIMKEQFI